MFTGDAKCYLNVVINKLILFWQQIIFFCRIDLNFKEINTFLMVLYIYTK